MAKATTQGFRIVGAVPQRPAGGATRLKAFRDVSLKVSDFKRSTKSQVSRRRSSKRD